MSLGRIFITGTTGFIGARLLRSLLERGEDVAILLRPGANTIRIDDLLDSCVQIYGSLDSISQIQNQLISFSPDTVIHLAWSGVENTARNDLRQLDNIAYSRDLYNLTDEIGCRRFLGLGSQAEYGVMRGKIHEDSIPSPTSLYGLSKLAAGITLNMAANSSGRPFTWLRLFSCYGPGDNPVWLIPYVIKTLLNGEKPSLTKGEQVWDYLYIDDVVDGIIAALVDDLRGIFNLGSGAPVALKDILSTIRDSINPNLPMGFGEVDYRPDQVMHLEASMEKFFSKSNWRPSKPHAVGVPLTVSAYVEAKKNYEK